MTDSGPSRARQSGVIEGVTIPGINDRPGDPPESRPHQPPPPSAHPDGDAGRAADRGTDPAPKGPRTPESGGTPPAVLPDRDLIQAARLQARHRQANRAQTVAQQDSIPGYTIKRELFRGGQGVVYLAVCDATSAQVAIKVIRDGSLATDAQRDRFEREIRVLAQLRHPNIVSVLDSGRVEGSGYLVMDYIDGCDLAAYIERRDPPIEDVLRLFLKVCEAVKAAHVRGVIHRDLKPGNVMVDTRGEPHVLDFGLAKLRGDETHATEDGAGAGALSANTRDGQFLGSLPFASPEQARGDVSKVDVRTDVYAMGVILYRVLTGRFPYPVEGSIAEVAQHIDRTEPDRASRHRPEICDQLDIILIRALAKSRSRRYQSVSELAADIERLLMRESIDAKRDGTLYVLSRLAWRHRVVAAALVSSVGVLALTSSIFGSRLADKAAELEAAQAEIERQRVEIERLRPTPEAPTDPAPGVDPSP